LKDYLHAASERPHLAPVQIQQATPVKTDFAGRWFDQTQDAATHRGFAAARFADQSQGLASIARERNATDGANDLLVRDWKMFLEVYDFNQWLIRHFDLL
jgi:hypothetical protein